MAERRERLRDGLRQCTRPLLMMALTPVATVAQRQSLGGRSDRKTFGSDWRLRDRRVDHESDFFSYGACRFPRASHREL